MDTLEHTNWLYISRLKYSMICNPSDCVSDVIDMFGCIYDFEESTIRDHFNNPSKHTLLLKDDIQLIVIVVCHLISGRDVVLLLRDKSDGLGKRIESVFDTLRRKKGYTHPSFRIADRRKTAPKHNCLFIDMFSKRMIETINTREAVVYVRDDKCIDLLPSAVLCIQDIRIEEREITNEYELVQICSDLAKDEECSVILVTVDKTAEWLNGPFHTTNRIEQKEYSHKKRYSNLVILSEEIYISNCRITKQILLKSLTLLQSCQLFDRDKIPIYTTAETKQSLLENYTFYNKLVAKLVADHKRPFQKCEDAENCLRLPMPHTEAGRAYMTDIKRAILDLGGRNTWVQRRNIIDYIDTRHHQTLAGWITKHMQTSGIRVDSEQEMTSGFVYIDKIGKHYRLMFK